MTTDWVWPHNEDELMDNCRRRAWQLYQGSSLEHEAVALDLGRFLKARIEEDAPAGPSRDALLSVVALHLQTATYLSCGDKLIRQSLAVLLRLAAGFADHPDYDQAWEPTA